jgi:hypothetical protein
MAIFLCQKVMMRTLFFLIVLPFFVLSCENKDCCTFPGESATELHGTWLLYERGYSPGAGYITEAVSAEPAQTITFQRDGKINTNFEGWKDYTFYRVLHDDQTGDDVLALFKEEPHGELDVRQLEHSYSISYDDDGNLRLAFRWCIEGCHLGFKRI